MVGRRVKRAAPGVTLFRLCRHTHSNQTDLSSAPQLDEQHPPHQEPREVRQRRRRHRRHHPVEEVHIRNSPPRYQTSLSGLPADMARPLQHRHQVEDGQVGNELLVRLPRAQRSRGIKDDGTPTGLHVRVHPPARQQPRLDAPCAGPSPPRSRPKEHDNQHTRVNTRNPSPRTFKGRHASLSPTTGNTRLSRTSPGRATPMDITASTLKPNRPERTIGENRRLRKWQATLPLLILPVELR